MAGKVLRSYLDPHSHRRRVQRKEQLAVVMHAPTGQCMLFGTPPRAIGKLDVALEFQRNSQMDLVILVVDTVIRNQDDQS